MKKTTALLLFLISMTNCWALKPDKNYISKPEDLQLSYKEQQISTKDGLNLLSWTIAPDKTADKKTTVILTYGDSGNMSYWLNQAWVLSNNGYTVVLFDYRGFGHSDAFDINNDYLYYNEFATDLEAVIQWTKTAIKNPKTGIWALSMGTIMTNMALQHQKVDFVIAEGLVYDPAVIAQKIKALKNKTIILPDNRFDIQKLSAKIDCQYLLFAGTQDKMTTTEDSKKFVQMAPKRKLSEFDGNHLEGFSKLTKEQFGDLYIRQMDAFLNGN